MSDNRRIKKQPKRGKRKKQMATPNLIFLIDKFMTAKGASVEFSGEGMEYWLDDDAVIVYDDRVAYVNAEGDETEITSFQQLRLYI